MSSETSNHDRREVVALHEAAHAVVAVHLGLTVRRCTVTPSADHGAHIELQQRYCPPKTVHAPTVTELERLSRSARQAYAGHLAEKKRYGPKHTPGSTDDIADVKTFANDLYPDEPSRQNWCGKAMLAAKQDVDHLWSAIEAHLRDRTHSDVVAVIDRHGLGEAI